MRGLSRQAVFDRVVTHLLTQGRRALGLRINHRGNEVPSCMYRAPKGLKCAVGVLIADEDYESTMEVSLTCLIWTFSHKSSVRDVIAPHHELLGYLQDIHDGSPPEDWERELRALATRGGLKFNWQPKETAT